MRLWLICILCLTLCLGEARRSQHQADTDDNDFAEFEDFDDEEDGVVMTDDEAEFPDERETVGEKAPPTAGRRDEEEEEEEGIIENEDDEFEHFNDEDEFEGFDREGRPGKGKSQDVPDLKIAKVPIHLRTNWDSFYLEMLMLSGLGVYFLNFLAGKTKNNKLAQAWLSSHKEILDNNFAIVGDDGQSKEATSGTLMKESEHVYALWCSGRVCVEGMLVELKLLKRQDLINVMSNLFKPAADQILETVDMGAMSVDKFCFLIAQKKMTLVTVDMDAMSMDKFCFLVAQKKICSKLHKEKNDLAQFTEKKSVEKYSIPSCFQILSEIGEATSAILDNKMCQALTKYAEQIEYIHISDQYSGVKPQEETAPSKMPDVKSVLIFCFNVAGKGKTKPSDMEAMTPLLLLVFYSIDKVYKLRLGKEAKQKAEKNRQKAEQSFLKAAHSQLQEAAQLRREEKKRAEKEKMMNEDNPDKTRKWEEKTNKKDMKRKQPKVKMMKV